MKKTITSTFAIATFCVSAAAVADIYSDAGVASSLPSVSAEATENLNTCFQSDTQIASSKAIRACSKAYKVSIANYDVRSRILTRRGLLQLSAGRFDKASRDFQSAAKLNNENEFAYLGQGYAALMQKDYASAAKYFNDCTSHRAAAPLAMYGLGMAQELRGDTQAAKDSYAEAASMRPDWAAPKTELARINAAL